jgi:hypothetical protein
MLNWRIHLVVLILFAFLYLIVSFLENTISHVSFYYSFVSPVRSFFGGSTLAVIAKILLGISIYVLALFCVKREFQLDRKSK